MMKIKYELPPIWDNVCVAFDVNPGTTLFTYGDTIYNPGAVEPIPDHLVVHEEVHAEQQNCKYVIKKSSVGFSTTPIEIKKMTPELWWGKFLRDPVFRLDQEAQAYGAQYAFMCKTNKDRNHRYKTLWYLAGILSGSLYGNCTSRQEAVKLIQKFSGMK